MVGALSDKWISARFFPIESQSSHHRVSLMLYPNMSFKVIFFLSASEASLLQKVDISEVMLTTPMMSTNELKNILAVSFIVLKSN